MGVARAEQRPEVLGRPARRNKCKRLQRLALHAQGARTGYKHPSTANGRPRQKRDTVRVLGLCVPYVGSSFDRIENA